MNSIRLQAESCLAKALFCFGFFFALPGCGTEGGNPHKQEDKQTERQDSAKSPSPKSSIPDSSNEPVSTASEAAKITAPQCMFELFIIQNSSDNLTRSRFVFEFLPSDSTLKPEAFIAKLAKKETPESFSNITEATPAPGNWVLLIEQTSAAASPSPTIGNQNSASSTVSIFCQSEFTIETSFTSSQSLKIQVSGKR